MNATSNHTFSNENSEHGAPCDLSKLARDIGFEAVGTAPASRLVVRPEVRDMCAADRCHAYGRSWVCPPACGSLDTFAELIAARKTAVAVQTVARLEDEFDIEGMQEAESLHKKRFAHLVRTTRSAFEMTGESAGKHHAPLFLAAGTCTICPTCSYPDTPCRFPDEAIVSLEAAGLVVSDVCEAAGIPYYHGKASIAYTSCVLV